MSSKMLSETIDLMSNNGQGILAADESNGTIGKRFSSINLENTFENRRSYRSMLVNTQDLGKYINGIILFEETLDQKDDQNIPITEILDTQKIVIGIKVDQGTKELTNFPSEKITEGLDGLSNRIVSYREKGARFAKWRNVMIISKDTPSATAVRSNSESLARYATICQNHGIVPIVEPEILMDGNHTLQKCAEVTEIVLKELFIFLQYHKVKLEYTILKPNMVLPGKDCEDQSSTAEIAETTFEILKRSVPSSIPCINFLSGGQTPIQATERLNAINQVNSNKPWVLSSSFGRALQEPVLNTWAGKSENNAKSQQALLHRAKMNSLACLGNYKSDLEI
ncbi:MAG: fructose-bisphosphate aldolase class I [Legionellales bacterium]|nr:fructose-bisphosphate aldolase class I [Legionellales bacterium]